MTNPLKLTLPPLCAVLTYFGLSAMEPAGRATAAVGLRAPEDGVALDIGCGLGSGLFALAGLAAARFAIHRLALAVLGAIGAVALAADSLPAVCALAPAVAAGAAAGLEGSRQDRAAGDPARPQQHARVLAGLAR